MCICFNWDAYNFSYFLADDIYLAEFYLYIHAKTGFIETLFLHILYLLLTRESPSSRQSAPVFVKYFSCCFVICFKCLCEVVMRERSSCTCFFLFYNLKRENHGIYISCLVLFFVFIGMHFWYLSMQKKLTSRLYLLLS